MKRTLISIIVVLLGSCVFASAENVKPKKNPTPFKRINPPGTPKPPKLPYLPLWKGHSKEQSKKK